MPRVQKPSVSSNFWCFRGHHHPLLLPHVNGKIWVQSDQPRSLEEEDGFDPGQAPRSHVRHEPRDALQILPRLLAIIIPGLGPDIPFLKHDSRILRKSSNPVCGS